MAKMLQPSYHPGQSIYEQSKGQCNAGAAGQDPLHMSASEIQCTLIRLAHQIIEKNNGGHNLGLVGIKRLEFPWRTV